MLPDRIHGGSRENLLDFTIGRCYSIRMYHNVSDVYIIYSNSFKDGSCYFSHQPILRRIYQTGMRWSRLWERHMFSKGFTLVSGTRKSNASSLLVEPYTLPRYQGPIMGKGDKQHKYLSIPNDPIHTSQEMDEMEDAIGPNRTLGISQTTIFGAAKSEEP